MDKQMFRDAMARLCAAVTVVTTDGPAGRAGATVSAVCSVSDDPATLLVCLNRASRTNAILRENGALCVNVLAADRQATALHFAGPVGVPDRFEGLPWTTLMTGAPVLEEATVSFDCRVAETIDAGSHTVFLARVRGIRFGQATDALAYFQRRFVQVSPVA